MQKKPADSGIPIPRLPGMVAGLRGPPGATAAAAAELGLR